MKYNNVNNVSYKFLTIPAVVAFSLSTAFAVDSSTTQNSQTYQAQQSNAQQGIPECPDPSASNAGENCLPKQTSNTATQVTGVNAVRPVTSEVDSSNNGQVNNQQDDSSVNANNMSSVQSSNNATKKTKTSKKAIQN